MSVPLGGPPVGLSKPDTPARESKKTQASRLCHDKPDHLRRDDEHLGGGPQSGRQRAAWPRLVRCGPRATPPRWSGRKTVYWIQKKNNDKEYHMNFSAQ